MTTIDAHIIDGRGVYLRTEQVDPMGPQPAGAIYAELPAAQVGKERVWTGAVWVHVAPEELPVTPVPPEPVPTSCQRRQGRLVLLSMGLLDDAETTIAAIADDMARREAQIEYEADTWERANPFLAQLWGQLGGTPESLDDAFRLAVTL